MDYDKDKNEPIDSTPEGEMPSTSDSEMQISPSAISALNSPLPPRLDDPKEFPIAPFSVNNDEIENIGLNSGSLQLAITDFVLPGKNGFDLALTRRYSSAMSNTEELTPAFERQRRYIWNLEVRVRGRDRVSNTTVIGYNWYSGNNHGAGYSSAQEARDGAQAYWHNLSQNYYYRDSIVWMFEQQRFWDWREMEILNILSHRITTSHYTGDVVVSGARPNNHMQNQYGLGIGWGFNIPSIETVGEQSRRDFVRYFSHLHVGDGRVFRIDDDNRFVDYKLQDITFSSVWGSIGGRQYTRILNYKDGRKAYFNGSNRTSFQLIAMTDRFGNTISFNLNANGGSITDTLGRTIHLSRTNISGGHILRWTLPDNSAVTYTVQNNLLTSVMDQEGRVTSYGYTSGNIRKSYRSSWQHGDAGVNIMHWPLNRITYPTGASSRYNYEFRQSISSLLGSSQGMPLIVRRADHESTGAVRNQRDYEFTTTWHRLLSDYDQRLFISFARVMYIDAETRIETKRDDYTFAYQRPLSRHVTRVGNAVVRERNIPSHFHDILPTSETVRQMQSGRTLTFQSEWTYDVRGNMLSETRPIAGRTTMTYDAAYNLPLRKIYNKDPGTQIREEYTLRADKKVAESYRVFERDALRAAIRFSYDGDDNLSSERHHVNLNFSNSADDRVISYAYANRVYLSEKRIAGVRNIDGAALPDIVERYDEHDAFGRVRRQTDANNRITRFEYDRLGRVVRATYADNKSKTTEYSPPPLNTITVTDENGNRQRMEYDSLGNLSQVFALEPDTCLSSNRYDPMNRLLHEYTYSTEGTTTTAYTYDAFDRVLNKTVTGSNFTTYEERFSYDDAFDPARQFVRKAKEVIGDASAPTVTTHVLKDILGRVREETMGGAITINTYDNIGNLISQRDPNNNTATWTYDHAGRALTETRLDETGNVTARTEYDNIGNKRSFTDFRGKITELAYDVAGRLLEQRADLQGAEKMITRYDYDPAGNVTSQRVLLTGNTWRNTRYTYDNRNRVSDTIMNDGRTETRTRIEYDGVGNKTAMFTGMLGGSADGAQRTTYTYDRFGNMRTMTDPIGNLPDPDNPARRTETYTYDNFGRLRSKRDRNGDRITYTYDGLGRVLSVRGIDSASKHPDVARSYAYTKTGQKASEQNAELRVVFVYDDMGRLVMQTETCLTGAPNTVVKSYGYDAVGNRTSFVMAKDGVQQISLAYEYGRLNRIKHVRRNGAIIASYTYDANGNRSTLNYPQSGIATEYSYNDGNLLTDLHNRRSGSRRSSYHYRYFNDGNQSQKICRVAGQPDKTTDYLYDRLGRLTEEHEQNGRRIQYEYDRFSNRSSMTVTDANNQQAVTVYTYDPRNRLDKEIRLNGDGSEEIFDYIHDYNGNQTKRQWEKFTPRDPNQRQEPGRVGFYSDKFNEGAVVLEKRAYSVFGELVSHYRDTKETRYAYAPSGLRHKNIFADGASQSHIWDGAEVVAEYGANGAIHSRYLRGINLIAGDQDNQLQYYLFNGHGDVVGLTDAAGNPIKLYDYDAFGNEKAPDLNDANLFRYCGEMWDCSAQTYYLRNRCYAPRTGRFTREDPIHSGLNWYVYADNNPIRFIDPMGLECFTPELAALRREIARERLQRRLQRAIDTRTKDALDYLTGTPASESYTGSDDFTGDIEALRKQITDPVLGPLFNKVFFTPGNITDLTISLLDLPNSSLMGAIVNVGMNIRNNVQAGVPTERIASDAVVDSALSLTGLTLGAKFGPKGAIVGLIIDGVLIIPVGDQTIGEHLKDWVFVSIDERLARLDLSNPHLIPD